MKIRTQLIVTMSLFGLVLVITFLSLLITNRQVERLSQQQQIAQNIERGARELAYLSNDYLLYGESQQRARWESRFASFSKDVSSLTPSNPEQQVLLNNIKANQDRLATVFADVASTLEGAAQTPDTTRLAFVQVSWSRMEVQNQGMVFDAQLLSQKLRGEIDQLNQTNDILIFVLLGILGAYFIANYLLIYRHTLRSISELQKGTEIIGSGNLDFAIRAKASDEIGELARAFNRMTANLKEVTASKADLEREIAERKKVEEAVRRSEALLRAVLDNSPDPIFLKDRESRLLLANPATLAVIGKPAEAVLGKTDAEFYEDTAAGRAIVENDRRIMDSGQMEVIEESFLASDGKHTYLSTKAPYRDTEGRVIGVIGVAREITARKRAEEDLARLNRTLRAHSHSDQALMRATDEVDYMNQVCRIIVEDCGHAMVWIGFAEDDEAKSVRPVAFAGFEDGYLETLRVTWADTERGRGPTGTAIRTGQPSFCRNMTTDPKFAPWREQALRRGYASSLVLPLLENGRAFGALTVYFREPDPFTEEEVSLLASLADDLAYGIKTLQLRAAHAKAEEALRTSEERYRSLFESINEGFALHEIICDSLGRPVDYRFLEINPAFERLTGLKREHLIGKTVRTVMPGTEDYWIQTYGRVALTGEPAHLENYASELDQYYEVFAHRPAPGQFAVLFLNVSARKRAEERIQRLNNELEQQTEELQQANLSLEESLAEEQVAREEAEAGRNVLESLMHYAPEVIFIADAPNARIRMVSQYAEVMTGHPLADLLGIPTGAHPLSQDLFASDGITPLTFDDLPIARAVKRGETILDYEMTLCRPDGAKRTVLANGGPIRDARGNITGSISLWRDISIRKEIEQQVQRLNRDLERRAIDLEIANKELESFSYSVSHDLRTPLASIHGFANLLLNDYGAQLSPAALKYLELIRNNSAEMNQLVEGLLAFSRSIRQPLKKQTVDMNRLVRQTLEDLHAPQQDRRVETHIGELPACQADPVLLKQVLINLLSNALKFTRPREAACIEIKATQTDDGETLYSVRDNGVGFDMEQADHLFGVFQRLHSQEDFEGTGVGLAIVERIIKRHGGRVCAEGEVDRGATFYFTLG